MSLRENTSTIEWISAQERSVTKISHTPLLVEIFKTLIFHLCNAGMRSMDQPLSNITSIQDTACGAVILKVSIPDILF